MEMLGKISSGIFTDALIGSVSVSRWFYKTIKDDRVFRSFKLTARLAVVTFTDNLKRLKNRSIG